MAIRYYDEAIAQKLIGWLPENSKLRVLKPDETTRLFETMADDSNDKPLKLPFIALSRNNDIEISGNIKQDRSFNGLKLVGDGSSSTLLLNVIPIKVQYQLDIYTKREDEGDEYLRTFLFKLINNPSIKIDIPYNKEGFLAENPGDYLEHIANIRVLNNVSDTSAIAQRIFSGQFKRWTLQLELQDAFLFSVPYRKGWRINGVVLETADNLVTDEYEIEYDETF